MNTAVKQRFPAPLDVASPTGAEDWQSLYSPYLLFSAENADWETSLFWYWDGMHRPDVEYPFDTIVHEAYMMSVAPMVVADLRDAGSEVAASRVLNGRLYLDRRPVRMKPRRQRRIPEFMLRAGHYFENWERTGRTAGLAKVER